MIVVAKKKPARTAHLLSAALGSSQEDFDHLRPAQELLDDEVQERWAYAITTPLRFFNKLRIRARVSSFLGNP